MHVAIDASPLETGHRARGVGKYTQLLIESLERYETKHSYSFFTRGKKVFGKADLVHYPYFDPFFLTLPVLKQKPTVVTVHDLIPIAYGNHFPRGLRGQLKWQIQRVSLFGAKRIIADSNASKTDIHKFVGYPTQRIDVVHLAPSSVFRVVDDRTIVDKLSKKYNLPARFVLYVGDVNWNKNVQGLIKAFNSVVRKTVLEKGLSLKAKLVFVGTAFVNDSLRETQEVNNLIHFLGLSEEVMRIGFVPEQDLVGIYNAASVCVQPSFAEGFGLPVLEAFACGCPVVAAKGSSLDEIAGPAVRVDARDASSIAAGILQILAFTPDQLTRIKKEGFTWVKQFSWKRVAHETVRSYEKALAQV